LQTHRFRLNNRGLKKIRVKGRMLQAIHKIFNHPIARKVFLNLRYVLFLAFLAVLARYTDGARLLAGFLVSLFGEAIQLWSFASLVKNEQLTARGPYVLVRNPMYLGRFFLILGPVLLLGNHYLSAAYVIVYYFYMVNRVQREERRLAELLGPPYRDYCARVNRFLPAFGRWLDPAVRFFDWQVLRRNNGHWNLLAMLLFYGVLSSYVLFFR
jgi:protein-S-isoprenylcysteine O-methyltransferase Ste14